MQAVFSQQAVSLLVTQDTLTLTPIAGHSEEGGNYKLNHEKLFITVPTQ